MGLLLAEGKRLKHLKEKPHHKIPYHDLSFLWRKTAQQKLRTHRSLKTFLCSIMMMIIIAIVVLFLVMEDQWNEVNRGRRKYSGKT
jgi:heme/copper-type cytochrome/quinol oxidase subunit 4